MYRRCALFILLFAVSVLWFPLILNVVNAKSILAHQECKTNITAVLFSPDSNYLAALSSYEQTIFLWNVETGDFVNKIGKQVTSMTFSSDNKNLLVGTANGKITLYTTASQTELKTFVSPKSHSISDVKFLPENNQILITDADGTHLWDIATGRKIHTFSYENGNESFLELSPNGKYILLNRVAQDHSFIVLWDLQTRKELHSFEAHFGAFSPDSKYVLTSAVDSDEKTGEDIVVWRIEDYKKIFSLAGYGGKFSQDGKYLLSQMGQNSLIIWSMASGQKVREIFEFDHMFGKSAFTFDNKSVLIHLGYKARIDESSYDLQDIITGDEYYKTTIHGEIQSFTLSPNNAIVAVLSGNQFIYLYKLNNGQELKQLCANSASTPDKF